MIRGILVVLFVYWMHGFVLGEGGTGGGWDRIEGPEDGGVRCFAEDQDGVIYAGTVSGGVFKSADKGDTWVEVNKGLTHLGITALVATGNGDVIAATSGGGVWRLPKGATNWKEINDGIAAEWPTKDLRRMATLAAGSDGDLYTTMSWTGDFYRLAAGEVGGMKWKKCATLLNGAAFAKTLAVSKSGRIWAGASYSDDKGDSWQKMESSPATMYLCTATDGETLFLGARVNKYGGGGGGVHFTKDSGKTWTASTSTVKLEEIRGIAIAGDKVFASNKTWPDIDNKVFVSHDRGQTFTQNDKGLEGLCPTIGMFAAKDGTVYLGANGAYRSKDGGKSWEKLTNLRIKRPMTAMAVTDNGDIYVSSFLLHVTCHGVARWRDEKWTDINDGLIALGITSLALNGEGEVLAADRISTSYRLKGNGTTWSKSNLNQRFGANCIGLTLDKKVILGAYPMGGGATFWISEDGGSTFVPRWKEEKPAFPQIWDIAVAPDGAILMTTEHDQLCQGSLDNGITHVSFGPKKGTNGGRCGVAPDGTFLASMNDLGIHAYTGGRQPFPAGDWVRSQQGLENVSVTKFLLNPAKTKTFVICRNGAWFSTDGKKWQPVEGLPPGPASAMAFDAQGRFHVAIEGEVFRSKESR
ncbi:MAG: hypothetical protein FWD53_11350 [Phycisphaerales bacterium]|nr:hypothetical protein [Phycisphaerales bacterium]